MASLRLKFPEKEEPSVIVLSGARVTLGRLPLNTIQIIDRTLSGFHAEFVLEEDHYRLHDRGSTNGTFVNGESVTDFHLREACKVAFGALECDYSPETPAVENANVEALPTRSEINAVRLENAELKNRVESLREEVEALKKTHSAAAGASAVSLSQEEYDKLVAERESLKEAQHTAQQEITRLKTDLALMQRDRENLKKVAASAQAEFASFRTEPVAAKEEAPETKAEAASSPTPPPAVAATPTPVPSPVAPAPVAPVAPAAPAATPAALPKPSFPLPAAAKLAPKPPGSLPAAPGKLPVAPGSGVRPVPVAAPAPAAKPIAVPTARPVAAPAATPAPVPVTASAPKPPVRILPTAPTPSSKGGTQRIDPDAVTAIKPVAPAAKVPLKPPVKLPLQPTVKLQSGVHPAKPGVPLKTGSNGPTADENAGS